MRLKSQQEVTDGTQQTYARLAGILFLAVLLLALGSGLVLSHIAGSGTFAETAKRIAASERLYRSALAMGLVVTLGSVVLAFALYATLSPVNHLLALLAMVFTLGDSFLAMIVRTCGFLRVHLFTSAQTAGAGSLAPQAFADLIGSLASTTENIGGIAFGIGSFLFFYLFFVARYIPRTISSLGLFGSAVWTFFYFANLLAPEHRALFLSLCVPPIALADVSAGVYLTLFGVRRGDFRAPSAVSAG